MPTRRTRNWLIGGSIALVLFTCCGLPVIGMSGLISWDQSSDANATIGVYFNPMTLLNVHESSAHYIRVDGKTYKYHFGVSPGYFIVPELGSMVFETSQEKFGGPATIHFRNMQTGLVTSVDSVGFQPWIIEQASCGVCQDRWWVHERGANTITFGLLATSPSGVRLEFTKIDLAQRVVLETNDYWFDANGALDVDMGHHKPVPPGTTVDDLVGDHRAQAGLPDRPVK